MAFAIFLLTLLFIFVRPFHIPIWISSSVFALLCYVLHLVNSDDIIFVFKMVWNSCFSLVGLIIISYLLESVGFFYSLTNFILQFSRHKSTGMSDVTLQNHIIVLDTTRLFWFFLILSVILAAFFANDGAILVLTPIIFALFRNMKQMQNNKIPIYFLLSVGFVCDSTSNPLIISNLTNIITADYFHIDFVQFLTMMFLPNLFAILSSFIVLSCLFLPRMPKTLEFHSTHDTTMTQKGFISCIIFVLCFIVCFFLAKPLKIPVSVICLGFACMLWILLNTSVTKKLCGFPHNTQTKILKQAPWGVVGFSITLYIVVYAMHNAGLTLQIANFIDTLSNYGEKIQIFSIGIMSAIGSSLLNNLPMVMLGNLALTSSHCFSHLSFHGIVAHLLGCNIGPKLTPIGSLATLLWLGVLAQRGIKISFWQYFKFGIIVTPCVLILTLGAFTLFCVT